MKKHTFFIVFIIAIALFIGIWRDNQSISKTQIAKGRSSTQLQTSALFDTPQKIPSFKLIDTENRVFTQKDFRRHWSFVFFGYTACPDICPTTLSGLQQIFQRLRGFPSLQFIFMSIDSENDTPAHLKEYLTQPKFNNTPFIGVTGDKNKIHHLAQRIGIHISQEDHKIDYIEHGGAILLINPEGKLAAIFTSSDKPLAVAQDFKEIVHRYNQA